MQARRRSFHSFQNSNPVQQPSSDYFEERHLVNSSSYNHFPNDQPDLPIQQPKINFSSTFSAKKDRKLQSLPPSSIVSDGNPFKNDTTDYEKLYFQENSKNAKLSEDLRCLEDIYNKLLEKNKIDTQNFNDYINSLKLEITKLKRYSTSQPDNNSLNLQLSSQNEQLKMQIDDFQKNSNSDLVVQEACAKMRKINDEKIEFIQQINLAKGQIISLNQQINSLNVQNNIRFEDYESKIRELKNQNSNLNIRINSFQSNSSEISVLRSELANKSSIIADLEFKLNSFRNRPTQIHEKIIQVENPDLINELSHKKSEIHRLNSEISSLKSIPVRQAEHVVFQNPICSNCQSKDVTIEYLQAQLKNKITTFGYDKNLAEHSITIKCNCNDQRIFKDANNVVISSNCSHSNPLTNEIKYNQSTLIQDNGSFVQKSNLAPNTTTIINNSTSDKNLEVNKNAQNSNIFLSNDQNPKFSFKNHERSTIINNTDQNNRFEQKTNENNNTNPVVFINSVREEKNIYPDYDFKPQIQSSSITGITHSSYHGNPRSYSQKNHHERNVQGIEKNNFFDSYGY